MFLQKLHAAKRDWPAPTSEQRDIWQKQASERPRRSLVEALRASSWPAIIAEFKRASPAKGALALDLDPATQAQAYARGGAAGMSVLTEPDHFKGSWDDLLAARAACELPVLRKDFLVHPWEVEESAARGADAVLLIAALLGPGRTLDLLERCREFGLDALVEVHTAEEARWVAEMNPALVGINNRDLVSLKVDLTTTERVLPLLSADCLKVAESGFSSAAELARFPGVDAFLIGETLVRADDPASCLRDLRNIQRAGLETTESL